MEPSWRQADVLPIIARVIAESYQQDQCFVTAHEIAARLVHDREAASLIEEARQQLDDPHSPEWLAGNMVAWFGQRITVGKSEWRRAFERTWIDGQSAYKPVTTIEEV